MQTLREVALYRAQLKAKWRATRLRIATEVHDNNAGGISYQEMVDAQFKFDDAMAKVRAAAIELEAEKAAKMQSSTTPFISNA